MASTLVFSTGKIDFLASLTWRMVGKKNLAAGLRELGNDLGGSYAATCAVFSPDAVLNHPTKGVRTHKDKKRGAPTQYSAGFYRSPTGDNSAPPKNAHALAAAFARWSFDAGYHSAALCVPIAAAGKHQDRYVVVVHQNGLPVLDEVKDHLADAKALIAGYANIDLFATDDLEFPNTATPVDMRHPQALFASIASAAHKKTSLSKIPTNWLLWLSLAALLLVGLFAYQHYDATQKAKAKKAQLLKLMADDPIPKYKTALLAQSAQAGIDSSALKEALSKAYTLPLNMGGWQTKRIECTQASGCVLQLARKNGTHKTLAEKATALGLTLRQSANLNLDEATLSWDQTLPPAKLDVLGAHVIPTLNHFLQAGAGTALQIWKSAGLGVQIQAPALWPSVLGVPSGFKDSAAIYSGKLDINDIALPQLREVLSAPAANIVWTGWVIDTNTAGSDVLTQAKARVTGAYYAKP